MIHPGVNILTTIQYDAQLIQHNDNSERPVPHALFIVGDSVPLIEMFVNLR